MKTLRGSDPDLKHVPLSADDQCMCTLTGFIRVWGHSHQLWYWEKEKYVGKELEVITAA